MVDSKVISYLCYHDTGYIDKLNITADLFQPGFIRNVFIEIKKRQDEKRAYDLVSLSETFKGKEVELSNIVKPDIESGIPNEKQFFLYVNELKILARKSNLIYAARLFIENVENDKEGAVESFEKSILSNTEVSKISIKAVAESIEEKIKNKTVMQGIKPQGEFLKRNLGAYWNGSFNIIAARPCSNTPRRGMCYNYDRRAGFGGIVPIPPRRGMCYNHKTHSTYYLHVPIPPRRGMCYNNYNNRMSDDDVPIPPRRGMCYNPPLLPYR